MSQFVHLRVHSEYSLIDSLIRIKPLIKSIPQKGMRAVAITDFNNLFAAVKIYQAAIAAGVKPIFGCDIIFYYPEEPNQIASMVLLCQNEEGYRNLTRLISKAYLEGQHQGQPRVKSDWIIEHAEGLIALSGGRAGDIGQALLAEDFELADKYARHWGNVFPQRFYLEIQRTERPQEMEYNKGVVALADRLALPLVATNDVRFLSSSDFDAHEARVCIHDGFSLADPRRKKNYSPQQYLRSAEEMNTLFHDLPQAIQNTVEISQRCTVKLELGLNYLPNFPTPFGVSVAEYLCQLAKSGLEQRLFLLDKQSEQQRAPYDKRLDIELEVINGMGFAGYFLIVADFIQWAKQNGVPVGPGRGSGAGSLVAYALMITDLDPLEYELLFERFLNPERVSMPDFDIDFCMEGRDRVIDYVAEKYGRHSVSQIITFGTMAAKAVVRDVGRVLGHPYGFVDKLAKLIPFELGITLISALEKEPELKRRYEEEEEVRELIDLALKLEGLMRNAGKHAGGVVIAPSHLTDFTAIYCEQDSAQIVSQFDKDDVEAVGLVKFDFLGLRTLTIIHWALITINHVRVQQNLQELDINLIPMDDAATFDLLKKCQTTAVFQLESRGMKELIHRLQPDCFEEIIALVALFRPGPLQSGMVDNFIDRKHGRAQVEYPHPDLEPILKPTYGVILYQEQVMQIAQVLANYTLGGADLLRRAMGKKKPEEMAKQREIFVKGATSRGVEADVATTIFDLMEKFAGYGFNKSHSAAYALVAYQTAWLKAHHAAAFMAAVLSSDMDNTDKVVGFRNECASMHLTVLPPALNRSFYHFTVNASEEIIYGLGAIKGVGEAAIQAIIQEREQNGSFISLFDFCKRVDLRKINRRVIEALIKSGSMDCWNIERATLIASVDKALQIGNNFHQKQRSGQADIFMMLDEPTAVDDYYVVAKWDEKKRLDFEKETLGLYLSGHPSDLYLQEFNSFILRLAQLNPQKMKKAITCGLLKQVKQIMTKRGKKLAILSIEDAQNQLDVVAFSEVFDTFPAFQAGQIIIVEGEVSRDDYSGGVRMMANQLLNVEMARSKYAKCLTMTLFQNQQHLIDALQSVFKAHPGGCLVQIIYQNDVVQAKLNLAANWSIQPSDDFIQQLSNLLSEEQVELCY